MTSQAITAQVEATRSVPPSVGSGFKGPAELLRVPGFLQLSLSNALSHAFAMRMQGIAVAWVVLEMTGSQVWLGIVNGVPALSVVLFSLLAGVLADSRDSRRVLIAVRSCLAAAAFTCAVFVLTDQIRLEHLVIYMLVAMGLSAVDMPLGRTLTLRMIGPARLLNANSLQTMGANVISIVTPVSIAVVIGMAGSGAAFLVLGAGYALGTLFIVRTRAEAPPVNRPSSRPVADIVAGLAYLRSTPSVAGLVTLGFLMPFAGVYFALIPVFSRDVLSAGAGGLGLLVGAFSLGSLLGSVLLVTSGSISRRGVKVAALSLVFGAEMVAFALSASLALSCAISLCMGLVGSRWQNMLTTMVQTESAPEMRGRALSIFTMGFQLASLGWLIGGVTASVIGPQAAMIIAGVCFAGLSTLVFVAQRPVLEID